MDKLQIENVIKQIESMLEELPSEYYYTCLPLCIIDAIFSIGVTYSSTKNAVLFFAKKNNIHLDRRTGNSDYNIDSLLSAYNDICEKDERVIAKELFNNLQRTSPVNGITKAEAVKRCAVILKNYNIQTIYDFQNKLTSEIEDEIKAIPGQHSGVSLTYLKMLCGDDDLIKPDRHVLRFLNLDYDNQDDRIYAQKIVEEIVSNLKTKYPHISARKVDYMIWNYMSNFKRDNSK